MQNRSFLGSIPPVTLNLIIVNFIVWLAALTLPKIAGINLNYWLGLHYFAADDFNVVQLITYMFLHDTSGIKHIFFNMFSVFMFGRTLEAVWGGKRFLFYYITTGMGAALVQEAAWYFELHSAISETVALYGWEQTSQQLNIFITVGASGFRHVISECSVVHHIHTHSHQGKILCHLLRVTRIILRYQRKHEQRGSLCTFGRHALRLLLDSLLEKERNRRWRILLLTN
jgi:membrane associated rhomboid family serine protease